MRPRRSAPRGLPPRSPAPKPKPRSGLAEVTVSVVDMPQFSLLVDYLNDTANYAAAVDDPVLAAMAAKVEDKLLKFGGAE